jgi:hypothetical protein
MAELDLELERWQRQWHAQDAVPLDLAKTVETGTRRMRQGLIAEIVVTIVMGGAAIGWARASQRADVMVLAIAVWIFIAVAWVASLLLRRGAWQPVTATTAAFVEISILRCQRSLQAIAIQAILYVLILTFDLVWLFFYRGESSVREFLMRPAVLFFLCVVTPVLAAAALWYRRRLQRELTNLNQLQRAV